VLNVVLGLGPDVGTAIVAHPLVRKVAFTGSVRVGQEIGRIAADRILPLTRPAPACWCSARCRIVSSKR
jgi:aldehyde dehydrogenase (NAD+)